MTHFVNVFILVPSFSPAGPVKGAVALANALAADQAVTLCAIKRGPGAEAPIDPKVRTVVLAERSGSRMQQFLAYRKMLKRAASQGAVGSISFCLSADVFNALCGDCAATLSSVRGNLPMNYRLDYGPVGGPLGYAHLIGLRWMHAVVAMNTPMARQIRQMTGRDVPIIGNFIDEGPVEPFRQPPDLHAPASLAFLGSLTERKQPLELIRALTAPELDGDCLLHIIGDGPLRQQCRAEIERLGLGERVVMHGALANPFKVLAGVDCLVMPSLSEGTARAALEALHLGIPVVARDVDGNRELIEPGVNGILFSTDDDLPDAIGQAIRLSRKLAPSSGGRQTLLPAHHRQHPNAAAFLSILRQSSSSRLSPPSSA